MRHCSFNHTFKSIKLFLYHWTGKRRNEKEQLVNWLKIYWNYWKYTWFGLWRKLEEDVELFTFSRQTKQCRTSKEFINAKYFSFTQVSDVFRFVFDFVVILQTHSNSGVCIYFPTLRFLVKELEILHRFSCLYLHYWVAHLLQIKKFGFHSKVFENREGCFDAIGTGLSALLFNVLLPFNSGVQWSWAATWMIQNRSQCRALSPIGTIQVQITSSFILRSRLRDHARECEQIALNSLSKVLLLGMELIKSNWI